MEFWDEWKINGYYQPVIWIQKFKIILNKSLKFFYKVFPIF